MDIWTSGIEVADMEAACYIASEKMENYIED